MTSVKFYSRDFQDTILDKPEVVIEPVRWSNQAIGGPFEALIEITGKDLDLWEYLEYLRRPVEIIADEGDQVWWGYVSEVELIARNPYSQKSQRVRVGASLENMFNRVAVAYETIDFNSYAGERETTDWADDTESQGEYGIKEALWSGESATDAALAEQARDIILERRKYPVPIIDLNESGEAVARLYCRGWWDTMSWVYAQVAATLALSVTIYTNEDTFGTNATEQVAQTIRPTGGDINMLNVILRLGAFGTPTDNVTLDLYSVTDDGSGNKIPDALIASASSVDGSTLSSTWTYETFTFSPEETLTNGVDYALVFGRSGANDDVNYYKITVDTLYRYLEGDYSSYDGANWTAENLDAAFQIFQNDLVQTSTQIMNLITTYNQFFNIIESDVQSGVTSESWRDGDGTAKYETEQLLQHGTDNLRRMLVKVDQYRNILVYEEPEETEANKYNLQTDGTLLDPFGAEVRPVEARAGIWTRLSDVIPNTVNVQYLNNAVDRFIEITEYNAQERKTYYTARDELNPFEVGRPYDG